VRSGDKGVHKVKDVDKVNGVDQVNGGVGDGVRWWGGSGGRWRDSDALDVPSTVTLLTSLTLLSLAARTGSSNVVPRPVVYATPPRPGTSHGQKVVDRVDALSPQPAVTNYRMMNSFSSTHPAPTTT
jgi:hypothetical protein